MLLPPYSTACSRRPAANTTIACACVSVLDVRGAVRFSRGRKSNLAPTSVHKKNNTANAITITKRQRRGHRLCSIHPITTNKNRLNGGSINVRTMPAAIGYDIERISESLVSVRITLGHFWVKLG